MWKIYKITCKVYHDKAECYKSYVGITLNTVERRFKRHCQEDNTVPFGLAIKKYGKDNWSLEILEDSIKTEKEALEKESSYIKIHNTLIKNGKGYNVQLYSKSREIVNGKLQCLDRCELWKPIEKFNKNKNMECGYGICCKDCRHEYYLENKERDLLNQKRYRKENPNKVKSIRTNYRKTKNEKRKMTDKIIFDKNSLLSINELYKITPIKYCGICKLTKETTEFHRVNNNTDGFYTYCKECKRASDREYHRRVKAAELFIIQRL